MMHSGLQLQGIKHDALGPQLQGIKHDAFGLQLKGKLDAFWTTAARLSLKHPRLLLQGIKHDAF